MRNQAALLLILSPALAQECGLLLTGEKVICPSGLCCSQYNWCGTSASYCDASTCQPGLSGAGSPCISSSTAPPYTSDLPEIDTCDGPSGISCPGAGAEGYFYRCCSSAGHCGPKNNLQDQSLYCGPGCQPEYGNCDADRHVPPQPTALPGLAEQGGECGPIVNLKCQAKECCSGSNWCGGWSSAHIPLRRMLIGTLLV
jgi:basic endochitinase B